MATTEVTPAGVAALGKIKVAFVPAIASIAAPTTAVEMAAGINVSFYIPGGDFPVTIDQNTGDDVRLGSVQVYETLGQQKTVVPDITYIFDPQTPGSGTPAATLVDGYTGFIVIRYGILATTDWASTQKVVVHQVTLGARSIGKTEDGEFGKFAYIQKVVTSGASNWAAALAA